jgi:outer membrane receptor protein involved in Fe transport
MPVSNPFIPADLRLLLDSRRPAPAADFSFQKRLSELGPRVANNQYDVYQATLGLSGEVFDDWQYDVYAQVGANDQTNHQTGNVLTSRIEELTYAPDGGVSVCGGFDPFGLGSISPECLDYIAVDASNHASVDQTIVEASLSGPVLALPAGDLRVALGAFYKEDQYEYAASPIASVFIPSPFPGSECPPDCRPDIQGFSASDDIRGDDHNLDLYVEALAPLLSGLRGVESLDAVFGYRLSDYESAGSFDSWKTELLYQPIGSIRLRSSYQQAVRAASVLELYLPQLPVIFDYFDFPDGLEPCEVGSAQRSGADADAARVEALCLAQGVPADLLPDFRDSDGAANGVSGGNPDLGPEEASTTTAGIVWTPRGSHPLLASVQVSLDWYRIDIADRITLVPFVDFASFCYDPAYNPDMSLSSRWCTLFGRDATTGEIENIDELSQNAYDWQTDGVDMQIDWRLDVGPGQFGVNWLVSWIDSITIDVGDSTAPTNDLVGTIGSRSGGTFGVGSAFPEWKSSLHVSYAWQDLTLGAGWRYVDSMTDGDTTLDPVFRVPHVDYFDLDASYAFSAGPLQGLELRTGVENLTDEDPPIFPSFVQANTDPSQYDVFGRRYYASLRYSF